MLRGLLTSPEMAMDGGGSVDFGKQIGQPGGTIRTGRRGEMERGSRDLSSNKRCQIWCTKSPAINSRRNGKNNGLGRDFVDAILQTESISERDFRMIRRRNKRQK